MKQWLTSRQNNCAGTGVTITVSKDAFMSQARAATATSSSATPSATATPSVSATSTPNSNDNNSNTSGMSTGVKIGLGVGVGFGAIALGLLAWFVWAYSRRRRNRLSQSEFPQSPYPPSTGFDCDVELSQNHGGSSVNTKSPYPAWASPASQHANVVGATEYAQHNSQFERAELDPGSAGVGVVGGQGHDRDWKELPAGYYSGSEDGGMKHGRDDKRASSVPLLAELGADERTRQQPVELPADMGYDDSRRASPAPNYGHGHGYELDGEGRRKEGSRGDGDAG